MGEYATFEGQEIKIGTCESMYYLRADQRHLVRGYTFDDSLRYRFPFPDEDGMEPGSFEDHDRGVRIPGWQLPADFQGHAGVQFKAEPGYLLYVPCPEGAEFAELDIADKVSKNGWHGGAMVQQQRILEGVTMTVVSCGSCGAAWRLETLEDAQPVIDAFRAEADREEWRRLATDWDEDAGNWGTSANYGNEPVHGAKHRQFLHTMADRIEAGYRVIRFYCWIVR